MDPVSKIEKELNTLIEKQREERQARTRAESAEIPKSIDEQIEEVKAKLKKAYEDEAGKAAAQLQEQGDEAVLALVKSIQALYDSAEAIRQLQRDYRQARRGVFFGGELHIYTLDVETYMMFARKALERFSNNKQLSNLLENANVSIKFRRR